MNTQENPGASVAEAGQENPTVLPTPETNGDYIYFQKVIASMPFYINRVPVKFEPLAGNNGVLKLTLNDPLVPALMATAQANRGGIIRIDAEEYDLLKKKLPFNPLAIKSKKHVLSVAPTQAPRKKNVPVASVVESEIISGGANGVGLVGGRGAGVSAGTPSPAPALPPPATDFKPATAAKSFKAPVLKKAKGNSLSGGIPEPIGEDE